MAKDRARPGVTQPEMFENVGYWGTPLFEEAVEHLEALLFGYRRLLAAASDDEDLPPPVPGFVPAEIRAAETFLSGLRAGQAVESEGSSESP
jgi:hypothetical protein